MRILLRCDGGGSLGVGHVMRSLALAQAAVAAGHEVVVAGDFAGSFLAGQLAAAPVEVVAIPPAADADPQPLLGLIRSLRPDVVHFDSYADPCADSHGMSGRLRELVGSVGVEAVLSNMEDGAFGRRPADVVVDPTFGAEQSPRPDDGSTWLLRGSGYTPMRQGVLEARQGDRPLREAARTVLVVMGGTDPVGLAPAVVGLLAGTGLALEVTVIAVGENAERVRAAARGSRLSPSVLAPVDDLPAMMSGQDLVISAAGTSVWELCCIGVPMAVVWAVDNQREGYDRVVAAGAAVGLGGPELGGPERSGQELSADGRVVGLLRTALTDSRVRADLVLAGRHIVDGLGAWRVVRTWEQAVTLGRSARPLADVGLLARPATLEDARQLWEWRNDPGTRAGSRQAGMVPWSEHLAWLESSLAREDRLLLVVEDPVETAGPVGTVRWDLDSEGEWEVSVTVAPDRRGQSLARPLLGTAEVALSEVARSRGTGVTAYLAVVHVENHASVRLFETSGYVPDLPPDPRGFMRFRKAARVT